MSVLNFIKKNRYSLSLVLGLTIISFVFGHYVYAGVETVIASFILWLVSVIGGLLIMAMSLLIWIATYSNFIGAEPITYGWTIVRDVCNMFFILILLIIAFATVLRVEKYNYKTLLPKLILMAVLINFSKMICGFMIDFAQVIMLTFVNGFKQVGGGNLSEMLGITALTKMKETDARPTDAGGLAGSAFLALVYVVLALMIVLAMCVMLAMRIIMLWIYIVLSPIAYLLASFPQGEQYAQQWWSEFSKNLIIGPVLAFFIWLSFASLGGVGDSSIVGQMKEDEAARVGTTSTDEMSVGVTEAGSANHMLKIMISICMLMGGMMVAQQVGGQAGSAFGKAFGKIKGAAAGGALAVGAYAGAKAWNKTKRATSGVLASSGVQNKLGTIAGVGGVGGAALKFFGLRGAAEAGLLKIGAHKQKVKEDAEKKVKAFAPLDSRVINRMARKKSLMPTIESTQTKAVRKAALNANPLALAKNYDNESGHVGVVDPAQREAIRNHVNSMTKDEVENLSAGRLVALGKSGIKSTEFGGEFRTMLEGNTKARGKFNRGVEDRGGNNWSEGVITGGAEGDYLVGRTAKNLKMSSVVGDPNYSPKVYGDIPTSVLPVPDDFHSPISAVAEGRLFNRKGSETEFSLRSVKPANEIKGNGNTGVSGFGQGRRDEMAVDFSKIDFKKLSGDDLEIAGKMEGKSVDDIQGLTVKGGGIEMVAKEMVRVLDQEIKGLKAGGGNEVKLNQLTAAKGRLTDAIADPSKLPQGFTLVNSAAKGYTSRQDVAKTMKHETEHREGHEGHENEDDTEYVAQYAIKNKMGKVSNEERANILKERFVPSKAAAEDYDAKDLGAAHMGYQETITAAPRYASVAAKTESEPVIAPNVSNVVNQELAASLASLEATVEAGTGAIRESIDAGFAKTKDGKKSQTPKVSVKSETKAPQSSILGDPLIKAIKKVGDTQLKTAREQVKATQQSTTRLGNKLEGAATPDEPEANDGGGDDNEQISA